MKKLLVIIMLFSSALIYADDTKTQVVKTGTKVLDTLDKRAKDGISQVYTDLKALYNGDIRDIVKYGVTKADTLVNKAYLIISEGTHHVFQVLKKQQLVKSIHHLIYWIIGIIIIISFTRSFKENMSNPTDYSIIRTIIIGVIGIAFTVFNVIHFMEMWTGFINPEYGVYLEIMDYIDK